MRSELLQLIRSATRPFSSTHEVAMKSDDMALALASLGMG